jgi:hypothetical protein
MRKFWLPIFLLLGLSVKPAHGYIEIPYTLGRCVAESSNIVVIELSRINKDKNLLIFKKIADLKGTYPHNEIKHNIGKRGFHEREWKAVMEWAEVGKKAVFMLKEGSSETCIGGYWYQCYQEGEWFGMSHGEPFLLRTFVGEVDKLSESVGKIVKGEEVIVPCFADGDKNKLHERKGKLQRMKASLKKQDYDPKKDFVGWGTDGDEPEFKTVKLIPESTLGWRFMPVKKAKVNGEDWTRLDFADANWRQGKSPVGYGEDELKTRKGTEITEHGEDFFFRRTLEISAELLQTKGATFHLNIASDDHAVAYLNGVLVDKDPELDHEFAYWNREVEIPLKVLKPGKNILALVVRNKMGSSDLYMDAEFSAQIPLPRKKKVADPKTVASNPKDPGPKVEVKPLPEEPRDPNALKVDKAAKTITIACAIAPRRLPQFDQKYPIEVIATSPTPRGQKAHETLVTFKGFKPSDLNKAIMELGLKPGKPAYGEDSRAQGPEVKMFLEITVDGKPKKLPLEQCLVLPGGKAVPELKWHYTGSILKQPDPEKDDKVFGADITGTLISLFPVTDCCVFQSQWTMKEESMYKLESNEKLIPKEGTAAKLIIQVP